MLHSSNDLCKSLSSSLWSIVSCALILSLAPDAFSSALCFQICNVIHVFPQSKMPYLYKTIIFCMTVFKVNDEKHFHDLFLSWFHDLSYFRWCSKMLKLWNTNSIFHIVWARLDTSLCLSHNPRRFLGVQNPMQMLCSTQPFFKSIDSWCT
jgi:hypothetical protein